MQLNVFNKHIINKKISLDIVKKWSLKQIIGKTQMNPSVLNKRDSRCFNIMI